MAERCTIIMTFEVEGDYQASRFFQEKYSELARHASVQDSEFIKKTVAVDVINPPHILSCDQHFCTKLGTCGCWCHQVKKDN